MGDELRSLRVPPSGILASVGILPPMHRSVTVGTECHQVFIRVLAELAARFAMMDL